MFFIKKNFYFFILFIFMFLSACKSSKNMSLDNKQKSKIDKKEVILNDKKKEISKKNDEEAKAKERSALKLQKENKDKMIKKLDTEFSNTAKGVDNFNKVLSLCSYSEIPVLTVIFNKNKKKKDFDRPTSLKRYLEYLKDTKNYNVKVNDIFTDESGKITKIELIKDF